MPQRQPPSGPQNRPAIEHLNHLSRILDVIPGPPPQYQPTQYQPSRPNLPARREVIARPRPDYHPNISRLPARQDEYVGRGYARQVTQVEVLPPPRDWRPRPIPEPKTGEWRNYMLASCFGAVLGISGYTYLSQGGLPRLQMAKAPAPPTAVAIAAQQPRVAPDDAFRERVSNQLFRADTTSAGAGYASPVYRSDVSGAGAGYGTSAQSPSEAVLEPASNRLPQWDAPRAQAPVTIPQQSDNALLAQASYKLGHGDIAGARAAFETVAQRGGALGAFGLAETYDPNVLARRRGLGLTPDAGLARVWYERAARLGSAEAYQRLKKLTKPPMTASLPKPATSSRAISPPQAVASGSEVVRAR
jgi:hypothetical protein